MYGTSDRAPSDRIAEVYEATYRKLVNYSDSDSDSGPSPTPAGKHAQGDSTQQAGNTSETIPTSYEDQTGDTSNTSRSITPEDSSGGFSQNFGSDLNSSEADFTRTATERSGPVLDQPVKENSPLFSFGTRNEGAGTETGSRKDGKRSRRKSNFSPTVTPTASTSTNSPFSFLSEFSTTPTDSPVIPPPVQQTSPTTNKLDIPTNIAASSRANNKLDLRKAVLFAGHMNTVNKTDTAFGNPEKHPDASAPQVRKGLGDGTSTRALFSESSLSLGASPPFAFGGDSKLFTSPRRATEASAGTSTGLNIETPFVFGKGLFDSGIKAEKEQAHPNRCDHTKGFARTPSSASTHSFAQGTGKSTEAEDMDLEYGTTTRPSTSPPATAKPISVSNSSVQAPAPAPAESPPDVSPSPPPTVLPAYSMGHSPASSSPSSPSSRAGWRGKNKRSAGRSPALQSSTAAASPHQGSLFPPGAAAASLSPGATFAGSGPGGSPVVGSAGGVSVESAGATAESPARGSAAKRPGSHSSGGPRSRSSSQQGSPVVPEHLHAEEGPASPHPSSGSSTHAISLLPSPTGSTDSIDSVSTSSVRRPGGRGPGADQAEPPSPASGVRLSSPSGARAAHSVPAAPVPSDLPSGAGLHASEVTPTPAESQMEGTPPSGVSAEAAPYFVFKTNVAEYKARAAEAGSEDGGAGGGGSPGGESAGSSGGPGLRSPSTAQPSSAFTTRAAAPISIPAFHWGVSEPTASKRKKPADALRKSPPSAAVAAAASGTPPAASPSFEMGDVSVAAASSPAASSSPHTTVWPTLVFANGSVASASPSAASAPDSTAPSAASPSFVFGSASAASPSTTTPAAPTTTPPPAASPFVPFVFGSGSSAFASPAATSAPSVRTPPTAPSSFVFGSGSAASGSAAAQKPSSGPATVASPSFVFGSAPAAPASNTATQEPAPSPADTASPSFVFGSGLAASASTAAQKPSSGPATAASPSFVFGSSPGTPASNTATQEPTPSPANTASPSFVFGSSLAASASTSAARKTTSAAASPSFVFGSGSAAPASAATATPAATSPSAASPSFVFGGGSAASEATKLASNSFTPPIAPSSFVFGSASASSQYAPADSAPTSTTPTAPAPSFVFSSGSGTSAARDAPPPPASNTPTTAAPGFAVSKDSATPAFSDATRTPASGTVPMFAFGTSTPQSGEAAGTPGSSGFGQRTASAGRGSKKTSAKRPSARRAPAPARHSPEAGGLEASAEEARRSEEARRRSIEDVMADFSRKLQMDREEPAAGPAFLSRAAPPSPRRTHPAPAPPPSATGDEWETVDRLRVSGNKAFSEGAYKQAIRVYTEALQAAPLDSPPPDSAGACSLSACLNNRAAAYLMVGHEQTPLAYLDCTRAVVLQPGYQRARARLATCLVRTGHFPQALALLRDPTHPTSNHQLVEEVEGCMEELGKCCAALEAGAGLQGSDAWAQGRAALEAVGRLRDHAPAAEYLLQMAAEAHVQLAQYSLAAEVARKPAVCGPLPPAPLNLPLAGIPSAGVQFEEQPAWSKWSQAQRGWRAWAAARCLYAAASMDEAKAAMQEVAASESVPADTAAAAAEMLQVIERQMAHKQAGNSAFHLEKHEDAVTHYNAAVQESQAALSGRFNAVCYCNRAAAFHSLGRYSDALADCNRAIVLSPAYFKALSRRATLSLELRDYGRAVRDLEAMLAAGAHEAVGSAALADARRRLQEARLSSAALKDRPLYHYHLLQVQSAATEAEIKKAYRQLALRHHPDKVASAATGLGAEQRAVLISEAEALFKMIGAASATLSSASSRAEFDSQERFTKLRERSASQRQRSSSWRDGGGSTSFWREQQRQSRSSSGSSSTSQRHSARSTSRSNPYTAGPGEGGYYQWGGPGPQPSWWAPPGRASAAGDRRRSSEGGASVRDHPSSRDSAFGAGFSEHEDGSSARNSRGGYRSRSSTSGGFAAGGASRAREGTGGGYANYGGFPHGYRWSTGAPPNNHA